MGLFDSGRMMIFDGAMGTMLQDRTGGAPALGEVCNLERPQDVIGIHAAYLAAGCDIVTANTFSANRYKLEKTGYSVEEIVSAGVACAREAVRRCGRRAFVAVSIGPTGRLLEPYGDLSMRKACEVFYEMAQAARGADAILLETFGDQAEFKAALLAARAAVELPVMASMACQANGRLLTGASVASAASLAEALGASAVGFNCGVGPDEYRALLPELSRATGLPLVFNPNAGLPELIGNRSVYGIGPAAFVQGANELAVYGVRFAGGCCGTTPAHIRALCAALSGEAVYPRNAPHGLILSGTNRIARFGDGPLVISGRIRASNAETAVLMQTGDADGLYDEAEAAEEDGAQALLIGADGLEDPADALKKTAAALQELAGLPLVFDAQALAPVEDALFAYNGRPMAIVPFDGAFRENIRLAKTYGAVLCFKCARDDVDLCVGACLDADLDFLLETDPALVTRLAARGVPTLLRFASQNDEAFEIAAAAGLSAAVVG